ncbi:prolyl-tRNA editing protein ProX [Lachnospiraceae bacterium]|jgi:Ala-tRNA(Pro) deacylase|nr:prolyl-tRNA editing protein ProX [Lachnospiraceae bacterium]
MFYISEIMTSEPQEYKNQLQKETYKALAQLKIPFERVDTDEAVTMDDCVLIDQKLNMKMVKTLFLCNRKKTIFYLFVTTGEKAFDTKNFSNALGISRVSFGPAELMEEMLGNKIGAATVFGTLLDLDRDVQVIIDKEVADEEYYGCSDGTTTCYMKIRTTDIIDKFLPFAKHKPVLIDI